MSHKVFLPVVLLGLTVLSIACRGGSSSDARQAELQATESRVTAAGLGSLVLQRTGGRQSGTGDLPYRRSFFATDPQDPVARVRAALAGAGLQPVSATQRCDITDPCAFRDPDRPTVTVSVVVGPRPTIESAYGVDLSSTQDDTIIVVGVF
jgi:hypothetical protein